MHLRVCGPTELMTVVGCQKQVGLLMSQLGNRETELSTLREAAKGAAKADHKQIATLQARQQVVV